MFKQLWNRRSLHKTEELSHKSMKVHPYNKTYCITTESFRNWAISTGLQVLTLSRSYFFFVKIEKVAAREVGLTPINRCSQCLPFLWYISVSNFISKNLDNKPLYVIQQYPNYIFSWEKWFSSCLWMIWIKLKRAFDAFSNRSPCYFIKRPVRSIFKEIIGVNVY